MSTANTQRAQQRKKKCRLAQHHQQVTPCVCGTSICAVLLLPVEFFGACFVYVIDFLYFAAAVGGIAILDENSRTVSI